MADARSTEVCDAAAARIVAGLPAGDETAVACDYVPDLQDPDGDSPLQGRRVWVLDDAEAVDGATRGSRLREFGVTVLVAERYAGDGPPPRAWVAERVQWVQDRVFRPLSVLGFDFGALLLATGPADGLWPSGSEVVCKYDRDLLRTQRLFASQLEFRFQEMANV